MTGPQHGVGVAGTNEAILRFCRSRVLISFLISAASDPQYLRETSGTPASLFDPAVMDEHIFTGTVKNIGGYWRL
jgi:hypothetical protein